MSEQTKKNRKIILEKRLQIPRWISFVVPVVSVLLAMVFAGIFLLITGENPLEVYSIMLRTSFFSQYGITETIVKAIPLMLISFGVAVAFKMVVWNIGAEGQFLLGAWAASAAALFLPAMPAPLMIILMILAAMLAGGIWALIPGLVKSLWNVNEVITSLLLNYVAINIINYFVYGPWKGTDSSNFPQTSTFGEYAWLPQFGDTRIHFGLIIALAVGVALYVILNRTRWGYEVKVIGESRNVARYSGMRIGKNIVLVMLLSGALAGMAGMTEVSGIIHRLDPHLAIGLGYTAIIVAWLSKLNPFIIMVVSVLFGGLLNGGFSIQMYGIPAATANMIQGTILFFVLGGDILARYRIKVIE